VANLLEHLRDRWSITLISPPSSSGPMPQGIAHRAVKLTGPGLSYPWRFNKAPLHASVRSSIAENRPDRLLLWPGAETLPRCLQAGIPAVADLIDCNALEFWQAMRHARDARARLRSARELAFALRDGVRASRRHDAVTLVGKADATWQSRLGGSARVSIVPNGVDLPVETVDRSAVPTLVFSGTLDYPPNVDAALWAASTIWPLVRAGWRGSGEELRFVIAGRRPLPELLAFHGRDGIRICADVPDMAAVLGRGWVSVAPMRIGLGIKNKVLESWASGRPAVLTPLAMNGLVLPPGHERLVASAAPELAAIIRRLLEEPEAGRAHGAIAQDHVRQHHTWQSAASRFDALLRGIG
jgi:glycosyltransferase involved in cell wall biosynthesis